MSLTPSLLQHPTVWFYVFGVVFLLLLLLVVWLRRASDDLSVLKAQAEKGDVEAQSDLGLMYAIGQGVSQDYTEALKWYRKAAEQGDALALYNLGVMYHEGHGVPQDDAEADKWFRKAAEQGYTGPRSP